MTLFEQGDVIEVDFDPTVGHEPQKMRPALVVSDGYFNNVLSSLTVVCPITSTVNGHPLHIEITDCEGVHGCVCLEQIRAIDLASPLRHTRKTSVSMGRETMSRVLTGIGAMFGI